MIKVTYRSTYNHHHTTVVTYRTLEQAEKALYTKAVDGLVAFDLWYTPTQTE